MIQLFTIFLNNLVPIILAAGAGYLLGHLTEVNPRPLSQVIFYIFSPCLLFTLLTTSRLSGSEIFRVMGLATVMILLLGLISLLTGLALRLERQLLAALMLVSMFMNAGNFGLPVVMLAFGQTALSYASLYFAMNSILAYTVGTLVASSGTANLSKSFLNLLRVPTMYALLLAAMFMITGLEIPMFIQRTTKMLGDASIPGMLVLLGLQLRTATWTHNRLPLALGTTIRLVVSPLLTLLLLPFTGLTGPAYQAIVLESAMPTAVLNTMLATEFGAEPSFVSTVIFTTTVLSPLTLTPLLYYLGA